MKKRYDIVNGLRKYSLFVYLTLISILLFSACNQGNTGGNTNNAKEKEIPTKNELHVKKLTIHGLSALSGSVVIKEESVVSDKIELEFEETGVCKNFTISPQPFTLEKKETKKLTISVAETEHYKLKTIEINVKRAKDESEPKDIDDVIDALRNQSTWAGAYVDSDITLVNSINGFPTATVSYTCKDDKHLNIGSGQITKDIADIKLEIKATVTWNGNSKDITLTTTIKRIQKIEKEYDQGSEKHKITWDFSQDNIIRLLHDGKPTHLWEIKSVDVNKRLLTVKLRKIIPRDAGTEDLVALKDVLKVFQKTYREIFSHIFGDAFITLKNKSSITWQDLKSYVLAITRPDSNTPKTDEELFNGFKHDLGYTGTLSEFNALPSDQRTKIVKKTLNGIKESNCRAYGIPKDTPDRDLVERLLEKITQHIKLLIENADREYTYSYDFGEDFFNATTFYDNTKKWFEQIGSYTSDDSTGRYVHITYAKINNAEVGVNLHTALNNNHENFRGKCNTSQYHSFNLNAEEDSSKILQCGISNDNNNGKFSLTTTGAFSGTFQMEFHGDELTDILRL